ncbi:ribonuclease P protein component [Natribacillus halophilus]|uniref:Ribonuclease P protein component n=1 Tax=Natribacillus halophilus TaxID=549003 RepID=A0A1G8L475_9BACI|nr:ribonuclease P protein component [Natribacillus halophilus]SDI49980.1 ribonuclease P protein component [Natribacillus halophilus]
MKKAYRIKDNDEFAKIFKEGKTVANHQFVLYVLDKPGQSHFRFGVTVGRKLGTAVTRNRLKRWIREMMREHQDAVQADKDYIIIGRKPLLSMKYHTASKSFAHVFKRAGVWRPHGPC